MTERDLKYTKRMYYGGFMYSLANLLNDDYVLSDISKYKVRNLTDYHRNLIYHKNTGQRQNPETFIQTQVLIPMFPFSMRDSRHQDLFRFSFFRKSMAGKYKIYFVHVNLTQLRTHEIMVIKPMDDPSKIVIVDPMETKTKIVDPQYLFGNYYVNGFATIEHRYNQPVYFTEEEIAHLI